MSREIKSDLDNLLKFIEAYNLKHLIVNGDFNLAIKQQHKKYYAYLVYIAEIQNYINDVNYTIVF